MPQIPNKGKDQQNNKHAWVANAFKSGKLASGEVQKSKEHDFT